MNPMLRVTAAALVLVPSLALPTDARADKQVLWGYGVRGCSDFLAAKAARDGGDPAEYQRYEDWLTGFISGLNLALGEDVLRGSGIEAAMHRAGAECEAKPDDDFFNAAMRFVRTLSTLR